MTVQRDTDLVRLLTFGGFGLLHVPLAFFASDTEVSNAWFSDFVDEDA